MNEYKYKVGAYLRLSKGDEDRNPLEKSESNSISNQRLLIDKYLSEHDEFVLYDIYVDDGYTGTNFDRPEFQRLMADVEEGNIDCIIVKDFSRFGRERIETGNYIAKEFKRIGIRFIAINDNYDSLTATGSDNNLLMPIKTLTNDTYSRDISIRVRTIQEVKRANGEFIGAFAPYGYKKDPLDKNHLVPDQEAAKVVQEIFAKKLAGMSANHIAKYLKEKGIPTPGRYKKLHSDNYNGNFQNANECNWKAKQVTRILSNETYIGSVVQGRVSKVSYKVNKLIEKPKEDWTVVKNMHEPIVKKSDFEIVQDLLLRECRVNPGSNSGHMFTSLVFCGECGKTMIRKVRKNKSGERVFFLCTEYNSGRGCSNHSITAQELEAIVLDRINEWVKILCDYNKIVLPEEEIDEMINEIDDIKNLKKELEKYRSLQASLLPDLEKGLISREQFTIYKEQYATKEMATVAAIENLEKLINKLYTKGAFVDIELSDGLLSGEIKELNRTLLVTLVDRILIYADGTIEIVYRYSNEFEAMNKIIETRSKLKERRDGKN